MSQKQPANDRLNPELFDLPVDEQDEAAQSQVKGGRRVDFTEAYVNEPKLPSSEPPKSK